MPEPDNYAVEQHSWVLNEWEDEDGSVYCENYCTRCGQEIDYTMPSQEQFYSSCPEYEG